MKTGHTSKKKRTHKVGPKSTSYAEKPCQQTIKPTMKHVAFVVFIFFNVCARACLSFRVFKESLQLFLFFRVYSTCASVRMCVSAHHLCYWMHSLVVGNWCLVGCLSRSMSLPVSIHTYLLSWTICIINSVFSYFFFRALFTTKQSYFNTSYSLSSHATFFFTVHNTHTKFSSVQFQFCVRWA